MLARPWKTMQLRGARSGCACAQIAPVASLCLERLAAMLLEVCKNPTQPGFNHYLFESAAALIRVSAAADAAKAAELETALFPAFNIVLQQDVQVCGRPSEAHGMPLSWAVPKRPPC